MCPVCAAVNSVTDCQICSQFPVQRHIFSAHIEVCFSSQPASKCSYKLRLQTVAMYRGFDWRRNVVALTSLLKLPPTPDPAVPLSKMFIQYITVS